MIDYDKYRPAVAKGMSNYIGVPVIRSDQNAPVKAKDYLTYTITTLAGKNDGTWQKHADGIDRLMVKSIWSFNSISDRWETSVNNAMKAREWIMNVGRTALSDAGISVQSATDITNRDNILSVEYERKNGFDAVFYVFDEVSPVDDGYIETAEVSRIKEV